MFKPNPAYPTAAHERAAQVITQHFRRGYPIDAVLLVNSCARGRAVPDSCLDIVVLAREGVMRMRRELWQKQWEAFCASDPGIAELRRAGRYSEIHLDFVDGRFAPQSRDEAAGPDSFELEVGNFMAYSVPLWQGTDFYERLKREWLPYYGESLRRERLAMVRQHGFDNLRHIPLYVERNLYFQAFDRLYNGYREFLQALFIARRTYPIAYNKWIREQLVDVLGMPELYEQATHLFEIRRFESDELVAKGRLVEQWFEQYAPALT